jgi:hypothetical protein
MRSCHSSHPSGCPRAVFPKSPSTSVIAGPIPHDKRTRLLQRWLPFSVALLTLVAAVRAENWPAWRGQEVRR